LYHSLHENQFEVGFEYGVIFLPCIAEYQVQGIINAITRLVNRIIYEIHNSYNLQYDDGLFFRVLPYINSENTQKITPISIYCTTCFDNLDLV